MEMWNIPFAMSGKVRLCAGAWGNLEVMSQTQKTTNNFIFKGTRYKIYSNDAEAAELEPNIYECF